MPAEIGDMACPSMTKANRSVKKVDIARLGAAQINMHNISYLQNIGMYYVIFSV